MKLSDYLCSNGEYYAFVNVSEAELNERLYLKPNATGRLLKNSVMVVTLPDNQYFIQCRVVLKDGHRIERMPEAEFKLWLEKYQDRKVWTLAEFTEYKNLYQSEGE